MGRADALKPGRHEGGHPPLPRAELPVDTVALARYLIGKMVVREMAEGVASGRIVETEAYVVGDAAGHAYRGMTPRNRSALSRVRACLPIPRLWQRIHAERLKRDCGDWGWGPYQGARAARRHPIMQQNRQIERLRDLARGPGRLTAALRIDRRLDGVDLCQEGALWLESGDDNPGEIGQSIRIGIVRDGNRLLRFYLRGSPFVSGPKIAQGIRGGIMVDLLPS